MSQTIVQVGSLGKQAANNATSTLTATIASNGIVVAGWAWGASAITFAAGNLTDNKGNSYTLVGQGTAEGGARTGIWCCAAPIAGTTSPKLTNANASDTCCVAYEISGQPSTNTAWIDAILAGGNASNVTSGTTGALSTGASAGLVIAVSTWNFAGTQTITSSGTSFTADATNTDNTNFQAGQADHRTASVASASITETWTVGGAGSYSSFIASFNDGTTGTTPSDSDSGTLTDTANQVGVNGPSDTSSVSESGAIGTGSSDAASLAEQNAIRLQQTDTGSVGDAPTTDYPTAVRTDLPVRWWRLGDAAGTVAHDASNSGHDGAYSGTFTLGQTGLLQSDPGTSASFDGASGQVIANTPALSAAVALEAWVKASSWTALSGFSTQTVFYLADPGTFLAVTSPGGLARFVCRLTTAGSVTVTAPAALSTGSAHHLVGTFDGTNVVLYVDGVAVASSTVSADTLNVFNNDGAIGSNSPVGGSAYFGGNIQEVAVYDHALAAARVAAHWFARTTLLSSTSASDSASLAEASAIKLLQTDAATFAEQVAIAITSSDTATTTDAASNGGGTAAKSDTDSAALAEQLQVALAHQDTAQLGEAIAIALARQDAAALSELVGLALGTADTAAFAESVSIAVTTASSDSATTTDAQSIGGSTTPTSTDSASLAEQVKLALQATDGAGLAESMAIALARNDTATLSDLVQVAIAIADAHQLTEAAATTAAASSSESGTLGEAASIAAQLAATELGTLAEQATAGQLAFLNTSDSASLAEQVKQALLASPEGAAILEQFQVATSTSAVDIVAIQEAVQAAVRLVASQTAALSDSASVSVVGVSSIAFKLLVVQARELTFVARGRIFTFIARSP